MKYKIGKWIVTLISIILMLSVAIVPTLSVAALSRYGSRGSEVREIQTRLKRWGYYSGNVDGIYGDQTVAAVKYFQRKNGLKVDGIAGKQTLSAMGIASSSSSSVGGLSSSELNLLARVISAEARGEPYIGQVAVGAVILNRVKSSSFPDTLSGVVYQPGAFTCMTDGQINQSVSDSAYRAARDAANGWDASGGALYYYNPKKTSNKWMHSLPVIKVIGSHYFCSPK